MSVYGFRQLPVWWVRSDDYSLKIFKGGGDSGTSIAALKILLGLCALCDASSYSVNASYRRLQEVTGLSRPMISRGIRKLDHQGVISVDKSGYIHTYRLERNLGDIGFAKIPCLKMHEHLRELPNRGEAVLAALKIYVYVLSLRPTKQIIVAVTHKTIRSRTGLQQKWIRAGLDILINHLLVHVIKVEEINYPGQTLANRYQILGDLRVGQSHIR